MAIPFCGHTLSLVLSKIFELINFLIQKNHEILIFLSLLMNFPAVVMGCFEEIVKLRFCVYRSGALMHTFCDAENMCNMS